MTICYEFLGVIDAFSGTLKKNKDVEEIPPYEVALSKELEGQIEDCLKTMELSVVSVKVMNLIINFNYVS